MDSETLLSGAQDTSDTSENTSSEDNSITEDNGSDQSNSNDKNESSNEGDNSSDSKGSDGNTPDDSASEEGGSEKNKDSNSEEGSEDASVDNTKQSEKIDTVPEKYDAFNLNEGFELDAGALKAAEPLFKEIGLTQEKAQKAIDAYSEIVKAHSQSQLDAWNTSQEEWKKGITEHAEFGGDKLDVSLSHAARAMDKISSDPTEFRNALASSGLGNHPLIFEFLVKTGMEMGEDGFVKGGNSSSTRKPIAERWYGKT